MQRDGVSAVAAGTPVHPERVVHMTRPWRPLGARSQYKLPEPGQLLGWERAVWRVVEGNDVPADLWSEADIKVRGYYPDWQPQTIIIRPAAVTGDDPRARDRDLHLRTRAAFHDWFVYPDEHYPVCVRCAEPLPCREQDATRQSTQEVERMTRYEVEGWCPACQEPVTPRQACHVFPENLVVPVGPPVTFHLRNRCIDSAARYDRDYVAADPTSRRPVLYCDGTLTRHGDGTQECDTGAECPGGKALHRSQGWCRCRCVKDGAEYRWECHTAGVGG